MNYRVVLRILGKILMVGGALMFFPLLIALIYGEYETLLWLLVPVVGQLGLGGGLQCIRKDKLQGEKIYAKEGFVVVALAWVLMSLFSALPYTLGGYIPSYLDAVFEMVSGFTTTGATILGDTVMIEDLPQSLLMWRAFTHWVGGMGVLVFVMAFLPQSDIKSIHLMRAEVPGPSVGKLVSRIRLTARILYGIYLGMTLVQFVLLLCGGMSWFDALVHSFSTAGTGGFSNHSASIAYYNSVYIEVVCTVFMILFGINFNLFFLLLMRDVRKVFKSEELWWYLGIIFTAVLLIAFNIWNGVTVHVGFLQYDSFSEALRYAFFQVASIISTTGFVSADFNLWPEFSRILLMVLLFIGGCAGSTGGGFKVSRLIILCKSGLHEVRRMAFPRTVHSLRMDGEPLRGDTERGVRGYLAVYVLVFLLSLLLLSLFSPLSAETNFTAVATCFNNTGPGLAEVGPVGNFAHFNVPSKIILIFDMLAGRLEIFPILVLVYPAVWKKR